jgi:hypothetical protein
VGDNARCIGAECATSHGFIDINPDNATRNVFEPANFGGGCAFDRALKMDRHGFKTS